jgi:hypothetical protein
MIKIKFHIKMIIALIVLIYPTLVQCQIKPGSYREGLNIAFNPTNKLITGFYEGYSGIDETTGEPIFSCIFYITGKCQNEESVIKTYYPLDKEEDIITGKLRIENDSTISIMLNEEHGGCWNVWSFVNDFSEFKLKKDENWLEIRFIDIEKAFFYSDKKEETKRKAYMIKGDVIYIDKIEKEWVHCKYYEKTVTEGWIKKESLNID